MDLFRVDADRFQFLSLLGQLGERFGIRVHAYGLMDNHFHLLVETPEANLSRAMRWLGVSYSVWFNRWHRRVGHLFQGRFKAALEERRQAGRSPDAARGPMRCDWWAELPFPGLVPGRTHPTRRHHFRP